ncbi:hypothetical protein MATL_G00173150 [Megalops atlanticus]|uniref:Uncharacterized protein n=1 Tax=Megalops atlanticus TaxID=7932 RepID=A0A9D3PU69_MEGAT|nr:hypothetical protein MATL_G00173150 [Megalops atlanticus]
MYIALAWSGLQGVLSICKTSDVQKWNGKRGLIGNERQTVRKGRKDKLPGRVYWAFFPPPLVSCVRCCVDVCSALPWPW